jgi:hypothetical protein
VNGWDEVQGWKVEVKNRRKAPVKLEIKRNFRHQYHSVKNAGNFGAFERDDLDTVKYTLVLNPGEAKVFTYVLTYREGERRR